MKSLWLKIICLGLILPPVVSADSDFSLPAISEKGDFLVEGVVEGLDHPWGMAFLPNGDILVTERSGKLRIVRDGKLDPDPVPGLPGIAVSGQGGLLDLALHPEFSENRWLYFSYAGRGDKGIGTEVARGRFDGSRLTDVEVVFKARPKRRGQRQHFGSRVVFDDNGLLYISLGDQGKQGQSQDNTRHAGSIIRIHDDGTVPDDNPFVGSSSALPEIYSFGHRNVQGMTRRPGDTRMWSNEHGPQGGDEVNVLMPGENYGWPVVTYGCTYGSCRKIGEGTSKPGMVEPVTYWDPSIAPSGMMFYDGDAFPQWHGNLFVGSLKFRLLVRLEMEGDRVVHEERLLEDELGRIRDVRQGPDGYIYLLTDQANGGLYRIRPDA